jgi:hypothetical protein
MSGKRERTPEELKAEAEALIAWTKGSVEILNEALAAGKDDKDG